MICPNCGHRFPELQERLEGLDEIRLFMDPYMSATRFYNQHRKEIEPYIIAYEGWWRRKPKPKGHDPKTPFARPHFFSFKRLILVYMIKRGMV